MIYELNTAAWLHDVGARAGAARDAGRRPGRGVGPRDARRRRRRVADGRVGAQPGRRRASRSTSPTQVAVVPRRARPTSTTADVIGSAYCIRRYEVDARFGGRAGPGRGARGAGRPRRAAARRLRAQPRRPRPPVAHRPSRVLRPRRRRRPRRGTRRASSRSATRSSPAAATRTSRRGPTSPSSTRSRPGCGRLRSTRSIDIGEQADGVRCDMAMLMLNDVFRAHVGRPGRSAAGHGVLDRGDRGRPRRAPGLPVHRRGVLGPRVAAPAARLRLLLRQAALRPAAPRRRPRRCAATSTPTSTTSGACVRFTREPRRTARRQRARAGASSAPPPSSSPRCPGATLWHEGQFEGWRVHVPVFLGRRPPEPIDDELRAFHLQPRRRRARRSGAATGRCARRPAGRTTPAATSCWRGAGPTATERALVVVNYADAPATGHDPPAVGPTSPGARGASTTCSRGELRTSRRRRRDVRALRRPRPPGVPRPALDPDRGVRLAPSGATGRSGHPRSRNRGCGVSSRVGHGPSGRRAGGRVTARADRCGWAGALRFSRCAGGGWSGCVR